MMQRRPRSTDPDYLVWVRSLPCLLCGDATSVEAAHVRMGEPRVRKRPTGMGEKPDDRWTLPLCHAHHAAQHLGGERRFWEMHDVNPFAACFVMQLAYERGEDRETAERIIKAIADSATGKQQ